MACLITHPLSAGTNFFGIFEDVISFSNAWSCCCSALSIDRPKTGDKRLFDRRSTCIYTNCSCDPNPFTWSFSFLEATKCNAARQNSCRWMGDHGVDAHGFHSMASLLRDHSQLLISSGFSHPLCACSRH